MQIAISLPASSQVGIASLRALADPMVIPVDSTDAWVDRVNAAAKRAASPHRVQPVAELRNTAHPSRPFELAITPLEVLLALGMATAVPGLPAVLLQASGLWAVTRYLWAFAPRKPGAKARMSPWTSQVRYHSQTMMSEHLAIAASCATLERVLPSGPIDFVDAEWAGSALGRITGSPWPDYVIMPAVGRTGVILECKGTCRGTLKTQFVRGLGQASAPVVHGFRRLVMGARCPHEGPFTTFAVELVPRRPAQSGRPAKSGTPTTNISNRLSWARLLAYAGATHEAEHVGNAQVSAEASPLVWRDLPLGPWRGSEAVLTLGSEQVAVFVGLHETVLSAYMRADSEEVLASRHLFAESLSLADGARTRVELNPETGEAWAVSGEGAILSIRATMS